LADYIGLDIGTSGCKAGVMDGRGRLIASASREYQFVHPRPGWVELNPRAVWGCVRQALAEIADFAGGARSLAVSSIGESMVMTGANDEVICNASVYLDNRCAETVRAIASRISPIEAHRLTGVTIAPVYSLCKILWMRSHMRAELDRVGKAFTFGEYFAYLLCGERGVDPSTASRTMMLDFETFGWSDRMMEAFEVEKSWFAPIIEPGTPLGRIRPNVAEELGLPADMEILAGCHDQPCATLGAGALDAGDMLIGMGSSESLNLVVERGPVSDGFIENNVNVEPFFEERAFASTAQLAHGASIRWFAQRFEDAIRRHAQSGESIYQTADRLCPDDSGGVFFLPYMSGTDSNDMGNEAKGCFVGLHLAVDEWRMYRAVLEGLCYETRYRFDLLARGGGEVKSITASGGGAKSKLLMQMKSDALGRAIRALESAESGIKGLGVICAVSGGEYSGYREAVTQFVEYGGSFAPERDCSAGYRRYRAVSDAMRELHRELGAL
jgi:xylulokinase